MSTHNIHLKYRTPKRYPTIISIVPPGVALIVTFQRSSYRCLEQIFMVPKGFEPSKFDCRYLLWASVPEVFGVFAGRTVSGYLFWAPAGICPALVENVSRYLLWAST